MYIYKYCIVLKNTKRKLNFVIVKNISVPDARNINVATRRR